MLTIRCKLQTYIVVISCIALCHCIAIANDNFSVATQERILYLGQNGNLTSVTPSWNNEVVIERNVYNFKVSPKGNWLISYSNLDSSSNHISVKLYDLKRGFLYKLQLPKGYWLNSYCWWSENEQQMHWFSGTTTNGMPLKTPFDRSDYYSKINKIATYDIGTRQFSVHDYHGSNNLLSDYLINEYPKLLKEYLSPDHKYKLLFESYETPEEYREHLFKDLHLISLEDSADKIIFKKDITKFGNNLTVTELPWSPDSGSFVVSYFETSFLRELFSESTYEICVIDRKTLQWRKIAEGYYPYWLKQFPDRFVSK